VKQGYNPNTVLSYLLKRVPRTFATAVRIFTEIRFKFPGFKPESMIDFGSGLSSGSYAFQDVFQVKKQLYNIEPNTSMFKLSRFLAQDVDIRHFKALGELSRTVAEVDLVYAGYVLNEIESEKVPIYL
jgi:ribosomal protein RSM22 (predicted rRNA methylase)